MRCRIMLLFCGAFVFALYGTDTTDKSSEAGFRFDGIYSSHMLFQYGRPAVVSGFAKPGTLLAAQLDDQKVVQGKTDENGRWQVTFPAQKPGGPHKIAVLAENGKKLTLEDVLFGELWFCAGQSNMEYQLWTDSPFWRSIGGDIAAKNAADPMLRMAVVPRLAATPGVPVPPLKPVRWQVSSPETAAQFSAVGYFFGRQLRQDLKIPVGLIGCYWGGVKIEPWIPGDAIFSAGPESTRLHLNMLLEAKGKPLGEYPVTAAMRSWEKRFFSQERDDGQWCKPDFDDSRWPETEVPRGSPLEEKIDGAVLYRKTAELPPDWDCDKDAVLELGAIDDCDVTYCNGVKIGSTDARYIGYWERPRQYRIPAALLKKGKNVIAVKVYDFCGGGGFTSKPEQLKLSCGVRNISLAGSWKYQIGFVSDPAFTGPRPAALSLQQRDMPGAIYEGMVRRWLPLSPRGVIFYQGESNAEAPEEYAVLFPLLIRSWRAEFRDPGLAFVYAQLSGFLRHTPAKRLPESEWRNAAPANGRGFTRLREVQSQTLALPVTGMAVTIDAGDHSDIHPRQKAPVGFRMAKEAERLCYGFKGVSSGPRFHSLQQRENSVLLKFTNTGSGLKTSGGMPQGFAVRCSDGSMYRAEAKIRGTDRIEVFAPPQRRIAAVYYAFSDYPGDANLFNIEGFPMEPFRTDAPDWLHGNTI